MIKLEEQIHLTEIELAGFLDGSISPGAKRKCEEHLSKCDECLVKVVSAYESVSQFRKERPGKRKVNIMKKINLYLVMAIAAFALSFITPKYFLQLLVATVVLGIKWVSDSKSTKMLVMIYEAWKNGGEKEASRIIETLEKRHRP